MPRFLFVLLSFAFASVDTRAAETLPPANLRYANLDQADVPSFQRHVLPLMGRLGCNGRSCHGSFQGQGGFRLSLFGYDFKSDHLALLGGEEPRVDLKSPKASLMLQKPAKLVDHKGGKRMDVASWEYNLFLKWIEAGSPPVKEREPTFTSLDIEPKEILFTKPGETKQLTIRAHWSDGVIENVTPLCRFRSNDESIATVNESGVITVVGKGDTSIVAFYDNGVGTVPVLLPVTDKIGAKYPSVPVPTKIDELVLDKLKKLGVVPSDVCGDAEFLRRLALDLTGSLPRPEEVTAFLADSSADKRAKKIDELLNRPEYAAWWATRLCDFTGNNEANGPLGGEQGLRREFSRLWYQWIHARVRDNIGYDKIAAGIMLGVSRKPDQTYEDFCKESSAYFRRNQPADFTARDNMPFFWNRRLLGKPEERAMAVAHAFLGVNLQCASCHKHPYDQWTKDDFDSFSLFFTSVRYGASDRTVVTRLKKELGLEGVDEDLGAYKKKLADAVADGKVGPLKEVSVPFKKKSAKPNNTKAAATKGRVLTPRLLGGEEVVDNYDDPRQPVVDWMREEDNPYFARAFVNRVWASYFSRGLIEPADDLNLANPPSNAPLLDYLATAFIKSNFDMKWLHRTIVSSRTYQLSGKPNETNTLDEKNLSRSVVRRLPAEVAYDAIVTATASDDARKSREQNTVAALAIGESSGFAARRGDDGMFAVQLFGRPARSINCDCERSNEPALLQTVYLRNDPDVLKMLDRADGWLKQVAKAKITNKDELIRDAYLRTLSRLPDEREKEIARKHLDGEADLSAGLRDLVWVLINTKEFIVNH